MLGKTLYRQHWQLGDGLWDIQEQTTTKPSLRTATLCSGLCWCVRKFAGSGWSMACRLHCSTDWYRTTDQHSALLAGYFMEWNHYALNAKRPDSNVDTEVLHSWLSWLEFWGSIHCEIVKIGWGYYLMLIWNEGPIEGVKSMHHCISRSDSYGSLLFLQDDCNHNQVCWETVQRNLSSWHWIHQNTWTCTSMYTSMCLLMHTLI